MVNRYQDPKTGRFVSEDPIGFEGGTINLSEYVGNNPVNRIDPLGLDNSGCDSIGRFIKETPCRLECCAMHDQCYDIYHCTAASWDYKKPWGCEVDGRCKQCNENVENCFIACGNSKKDDPNLNNYYCAKLHKFIKIPGDFSDIESATKACSTDKK